MVVERNVRILWGVALVACLGVIGGVLGWGLHDGVGGETLREWMGGVGRRLQSDDREARRGRTRARLEYWADSENVAADAATEFEAILVRMCGAVHRGEPEAAHRLALEAVEVVDQGLGALDQEGRGQARRRSLRHDLLKVTATFGTSLFVPSLGDEFVPPEPSRRARGLEEAREILGRLQGVFARREVQEQQAFGGTVRWELRMLWYAVRGYGSGSPSTWAEVHPSGWIHDLRTWLEPHLGALWALDARAHLDEMDAVWHTSRHLDGAPSTAELSAWRDAVRRARESLLALLPRLEGAGEVADPDDRLPSRLREVREKIDLLGRWLEGTGRLPHSWMGRRS